MKIVETILNEAGLDDLFPEMVATFREGRVITLDLSYRNLSQRDGVWYN